MPYLTKEELESIFADQPLANGGPFWSRVSEDVEWTIMGSGPGTGRYTSLTELWGNTIGKLIKALRDPPQLNMVHVFFGGENYEWTSMELEARGTRKSGHGVIEARSSSLFFRQEVCDMYKNKTSRFITSGLRQ
ncbi:ketosteroid isomerase [Ilyonectria robusta]